MQEVGFDDLVGRAIEYRGKGIVDGAFAGM